MTIKKETGFNIIALLLNLVLAIFPILLLQIQNGADLTFLITSILFALPLVVMFRCFSWRWVRICLSTILLVFTLTEVAMVVLYGGYLLAGNVLAVAATNMNEASGLIRTSWRVLWYWLPCIAFYVAACWCEKGVIVNVKRSLLLAVCSVLFAFVFVVYKQTRFYHNRLTNRYYIENRILNRPPYNTTWQMITAAQLTKRKHIIREAEHFVFDATRYDTISQNEVYLMLVGESLCYDNVSLNEQYPRQTTPRLESMANVVIYSDYYSAACLTMWSVPQILTRATPETFTICYKEKAIYEPFKECGFHTVTITPSGQQLNIDRYLSATVDEFILVRGDADIPPMIDSLAHEHDKLFVMLEMYGSHSFYDNYTEEFDIYHPNINSEPNEKSDSIYLNAYDNTILYTDFLLSDISARLENKDCIAAWLFVSDHGESQMGAHAGGHGGDCMPKIREYHVPLIVWYSDEYAETYPQKVSNLILHKNKPICSDNVFYSVCDMANIFIEDNRLNEWSIFGDTLHWHPRTILVPDGRTVITVE